MRGDQKARLNGAFGEMTESALFLLAAGDRFLFRQSEKENGGRIACTEIQYAGERQKNREKTKKRASADV